MSRLPGETPSLRYLGAIQKLLSGGISVRVKEVTDLAEVGIDWPEFSRGERDQAIRFPRVELSF